MSSPLGRPAGTPAQFVPPPINTVDDTGLSALWLQDLALKILYSQGYMGGFKIAELLALQAKPDGTCGGVERRARAALRRIETKLDQLTRMRDAISRLATACRGAHPADECPMLTALDEYAAGNGVDAPGS